MDNKYYHRGSGEVVGRNESEFTSSAHFWEHLASLPAIGPIDPSYPVGWVGDDCEMVWQVYDSGKGLWLPDIDLNRSPFPGQLRRILFLPKEKTKIKNNMKSGIELIAEERHRQISKGYNAEHDETESAFQLSGAAAMFIAEAINKDFISHTHYDGNGSCAKFVLREIDTKKWSEYWPWSDHDGRQKSDIITCLKKAGALIAAEIDRLQNYGPQDKPNP